MMRQSAYVTPNKVALLVLVIDCSPAQEPIQDEEDRPLAHEWEPETVSALSLLVTEHLKGTDTHIEVDLPNLLKELSGLPQGQELQQRLLAKLESLTSIDELFVFFEALRFLILPIDDSVHPLGRDSMLGRFVRRNILKFDCLSFGQTARLARQITSYLKDAPGRSEDSMDMDQSLDQVVQQIEEHTFDFLSSLSRREAELYLKNQVEVLSRKVVQPNVRELQAKVDRMLELNPDLPLAHYVSYLNCMRSGEFSGALQALHRYYDFQAAHQQHKDDGRQQVNFQNATLDLAALHFHFGHWEESILAVHETIRIAQENSDHVCLQRALGWLSRLGSDSGSESLAKLFVARNQQDTAQPDIQALARYGWARHQFGQGVAPTSVLGSVHDGFKASIRGSLFETMSMGYMLRAGLWDLYGHKGLSALNSQLVLTQLGDGNPEDACDAYCKLALQLHSEGRDADAAATLAAARKQFPVGTLASQVWIAVEAQLRHDDALLSQDWAKAEEACMQISAALSGSWQSEREARYRDALLLRSRGQYADAVKIVEALRSSGLGNNSCDPSARSLAHIKQISLTLLLGDIHFQAKNCATALKYGLECMTLAEKHHLTGMHAQAAILVADILSWLELPARSKDVLDSVMVHVLSHGSLEEQGRVHLISGKLHLSADESARRQAIVSFERALELFGKIQAKPQQREALYFLARVYDAMPGHSADRDRCATAFRALEA